MRFLRATATELGRGLLSGLVGTAAMTLTTMLEMKLRRRAPSKTPAKAVEDVLGVNARDDAAEERLANVVHWSYGTGWGLTRAMIGAAGIENRAFAPALHFAVVWGASLLALPALRLAPPFWKWAPEEIATDVFHHAVYVAATDAAYRAMR